MNSAVTKIISLLLLIVVGFLFQKRIKAKEQTEGIKTIILSLALPSTIFIALLQIHFESDLILIPVLSLAFNIILYFIMDKLPLRAIFNLPENQYRTLIMLIPSLAPGLSCFPFISEFSGQSSLAMAALADIGNKIFVLIISYTIAMKWYYDTNKDETGNDPARLKKLILTLVKEPVNLVIIASMVMIAFGLNYSSIPSPLALSIDKLSILMTPLILLFIGLSIRLNWTQMKVIFAFLFLRSSIAFALSAAIIFLLPVTDVATALLIVVFPQSACSFWPYSHMSLVGQLEISHKASQLKTFDPEFALNTLALSMPFSVIMIITIYSAGTLFASPTTLFTCSSASFAVAALIGMFTKKLFLSYKDKIRVQETTTYS